MPLDAAQRELSRAYVGGAPGVLISGLVWLAAGTVWATRGAPAGFLTLFVGGMLIMPGSVALSRLLFRAPKIAPGNPLERLGFESTVMLFAGLLIAYALLRSDPAMAFATLAVAIGARYFVFRTLYNEPLYWLLGALLAALGMAVLLRWTTMPVNVAVAVGAVELLMALLLLLRHRRR